MPYLAFRRRYFGDWLPNTSYAKEKPSLLSLFDLAKVVDLLSSVFGILAAAAVGLLMLKLLRLPATVR